MPGSIHVSAVQLPVTSPVFLKVAVGKREYNGTIGEENFSFPVMSLRENMVMMLYDADSALISQEELKTKAIVETGTREVIFALDDGGNVILRLQFLLSDEDRKRIREMRNCALKRKQQELLRDSHGFSFPGTTLTYSPPSKQQIEEISNIPSKGNQPTLRKSLSLDDLQERAIFSGNGVDPHQEPPRDLSSQSGESSSNLGESIKFQKGNSKPESKSNSSVKKMISAFESSSSQGPTPITRIKSESSLKGMSSVAKSVSSGKLPEANLQRKIELSEEPYHSASRIFFVHPEGSQNLKNNNKPVKPRFVTVTEHGSPTLDSQHSTEWCNIRDISTKSSNKASTSGASANALSRTPIGHAVGTSGEVPLPSDGRGFNSRSEKHFMFIHEKSDVSGETGSLRSGEGANCSSSSSGDQPTKQNARESARKSRDLNMQMVSSDETSAKKQSFQVERALSREVLDQCTLISDVHLLEQMHVFHPSNSRSSRNYFHQTFNIWMHPHLCITTGSRQLRDLLEHSDALAYMHQPNERLAFGEEAEERTSDGEARNKTTCNRTNGSPVLNGWLINQGVRVVIVIVACGAIFLNNR